MDLIALNAAIDAYEADLERPSHGRGTCIAMRASAREAAISAFKKHQVAIDPLKDSEIEGKERA